jgi:hypothetical protein
MRLYKHPIPSLRPTFTNHDDHLRSRHRSDLQGDPREVLELRCASDHLSLAHVIDQLTKIEQRSQTHFSSSKCPTQGISQTSVSSSLSLSDQQTILTNENQSPTSSSPEPITPPHSSHKHSRLRLQTRRSQPSSKHDQQHPRRPTLDRHPTSRLNRPPPTTLRPGQCPPRRHRRHPPRRPWSRRRHRRRKNP